MGTKNGYRNRLFRAVHAEALKRRLDHDGLRDLCREKHGVHSMAEMSDSQLLGLYREWTGHTLRTKAKLPGRGEVGTAVAQLATPADLEVMAQEFAKRGMGAQAQKAFIRRQLRGREQLRTRADVVKVTAGVRAMNRREGVA